MIAIADPTEAIPLEELLLLFDELEVDLPKRAASTFATT